MMMRRSKGTKRIQFLQWGKMPLERGTFFKEKSAAKPGSSFERSVELVFVGTPGEVLQKPKSRGSGELPFQEQGP